MAFIHRISGYLLVLALLVSPSCSSTSTSAPTKFIPIGSKYITRIEPVQKQDLLELTVEGSSKLQYTIFRLSNPRRLVIDIPNMDSSAFSAPIELKEGLATEVQSSFFPQSGNSRIEIMLNEPVLYKVSRVTDEKILVSLSPYDLEFGKKRQVKEGEVEITGIELREMSGLARVVISYNGEKPKFQMIRKREKNRITIDIYNAKVLRANERLHTVTAKESNVESVALYQFATDPEGLVKVVAELREFTSSNIFERKGELVLDMGSEAIISTASVVAKKTEEGYQDLTERRDKEVDEYEGKKISLDFQGANIHNILRIIADVSGLNIITSENVKGKVSMKLKDVPWDLALDLILNNNQLGMVRKGNIIRIGTLTELSAEKEAVAKDEKIGMAAEKLYLKVFEINYESVENLRDNLKAIKSERGSIDVNTRTNTLIIQETKDKLAEMEKLIEILDRRTDQVLIEARIVEVSHTYAKELGIRWGGNINRSVNLAFPSTIGLSGVARGQASAGGAGGVVDLGTTGAAAGAVGVKLGSVNSTALLDMELSALQNQGKGRIISMPKIATINNKEAIIESGRDIPYQTTSADGTKTEFKKATLMLKVTPHVAQDDYLKLEIEATKDEPDFANQLPNSPPPLLTKRAKTEVLVKDGDTTVIGGLFKENNTDTSVSVPFFSKIPFLGWLFRSRSDSSEGEELLIFITPRTF